jgi:hydrogenase maturation protein HypF
VALAGGCLLNRYLAALLPERLASRGVKVLLPRQLPPGDAAISLGQAWVATRIDHGEE